MKSVRFFDSSAGQISLILFNEWNEKQKGLVLYIHEFLGSPIPPKELHSLVDGYIVLPGYMSHSISDTFEETCLNWSKYGNSVSELTLEFGSSVSLLGNSMGAMVALQMAMKTPELIDSLVLYRIPTFGKLRTSISSKYSHVAESITNAEEFNIFLNRIKNHVKPVFVNTLESIGWKSSKRLYEGAAKSDIVIEELNALTMPIIFLDSPQADDVHPIEAREQMFSMLTRARSRRIVELEGLERTQLDLLIA